MNIPISKTCSRALDLPTKSVVLSSIVTKRMSKNLHHSTIDCLISDLIAKSQSCPTSSAPASPPNPTHPPTSVSYSHLV